MFYFRHDGGEIYLCKKNKDIEQCIQIQPQELKELQNLI
ncbi:hypothetical protein SAMN04488558_11326 [Ignavigranum ruoffiae]|uniref:Uncharacterized protein n=1 Tax=Ignavigranum ruoffiae TaxID=89093 RepID=A0A1H9GG02_9LACT|nr:hypothetical protein SAMN04488558_11326 [Ignavigranum ruoffiae]